MKNKKGFTLVELLAVIVILALIMGIAVVSIGGILNSSRQSAFKETAASIINGVRQQLTIANELNTGYYFFTKNILEKGADKTSFGDSITYITAAETSGTNSGKWKINTASSGTYASLNAIGTMGVYKLASGTATCNDTSMSFVQVTVTSTTSNVYEYKICLTAGSGKKFINAGTEKALLDSNDTTMISN